MPQKVCRSRACRDESDLCPWRAVFATRHASCVVSKLALSFAFFARFFSLLSPFGARVCAGIVISPFVTSYAVSCCAFSSKHISSSGARFHQSGMRGVDLETEVVCWSDKDEEGPCDVSLKR